MARCHKGVGKSDRDLAGQMIVADARMPQRLVLGSGYDPPRFMRVVNSPCNLHHGLDHLGDRRRGDTEIAMSAADGEGEQPCLRKPGKVSTRRGRRDAGGTSKLARGQCAAVHQRDQHGSARRFANE